METRGHINRFGGRTKGLLSKATMIRSAFFKVLLWFPSKSSTSSHFFAPPWRPLPPSSPPLLPPVLWGALQQRQRVQDRGPRQVRAAAAEGLRALRLRGGPVPACGLRVAGNHGGRHGEGSGGSGAFFLGDHGSSVLRHLPKGLSR